MISSQFFIQLYAKFILFELSEKFWRLQKQIFTFEFALFVLKKHQNVFGMYQMNVSIDCQCKLLHKIAKFKVLQAPKLFGQSK